MSNGLSVAVGPIPAEDDGVETPGDTAQAEQLRDLERTANAEIALTGHPYANSFKQAFVSYRGTSLLLQGRVTSFFLKQLAQEALRSSVPQGGRLINSLVVVS